VLLVGETEMELECALVFQVYVFAPLADKVVVLPLQIVLEPLIVTVGTGITDNDIIDDVFDIQPSRLVPVTEKVEFADGLIEIEFVFAPVLHVYELAPVAFKIKLLPAQTVLEPTMLIIGKALTVTVLIDVLIQPFIS
jgi:hypothetical protein